MRERPAGALQRAVALGAGVLAVAAAPAAARPVVSVFPAPGSTAATPHTQITLRGVDPDHLGRVRVRGSRTGRHHGRLLAHGDGHGASFLPRKPFRAGERVTVAIGGQRTHFRTAGTARTVTVPSGPPPDPHGGGGQPLSAADLSSFATRPNLRAPIVRPSGPAGVRLGRGLLFLSPNGAGLPGGLEIADNRGRVVWFRRPGAAMTTDFRAQRLGRRRVLTWWEGTMPILGVGRGRDVIMDRHYRVLQRVRAGNRLQPDLHDFVLTGHRTALMTFYRPVVRDLSALGGSAHQVVLDSGVQEVDLRTGLVEFEWHCLDGVDPAESYAAMPSRATEPFDFCHVNSVAEDGTGALLVSARNTHAIYLIDRATGQVRWRLGGKRSDFTLGPGATFAWQHDARPLPHHRISIFDNDSFAPHESRGIVLKLHLARHAATLVRAYTSPSHPNAASQGDVQLLPGGQVVTGWGNLPLTSEFGAGGTLLREWRFRYAGFNSYRAFRLRWTGRPLDRPRVAALRSGGRTTAKASWNGATQVARWQLLAGRRRGHLHAVASARRRGFETTLRAPHAYPLVRVVALSRSGRVLGRTLSAPAPRA